MLVHYLGSLNTMNYEKATNLDANTAFDWRPDIA